MESAHRCPKASERQTQSRTAYYRLVSEVARFPASDQSPAPRLPPARASTRLGSETGTAGRWEGPAQPPLRDRLPRLPPASIVNRIYSIHPPPSTSSPS